jgi:hypothetical protein
VVALKLKCPGERAEDCRLVVDDQDLHLAHGT